MTDLAQIIRDEIARRKLSAYRLGKETGVAQQRISALLRGEGMGSDNLSKLCQRLGLELRPKR